jgi:SET domain-containing protein
MIIYLIISFIIISIIISIILFNYYNLSFIIYFNNVKYFINKLVEYKIISKENILNWINHDKVNKYINPDVNIKYSEKIKGRGVFANKDYKINDILEICPTIKLVSNFGGPLQKYVYKYDTTHNLVAFGYCSIYNHSDDPNASYRIINENQLEIKIIKDIKKDEEIFVSYGDHYWKNHNNKKII